MGQISLHWGLHTVRSRTNRRAGSEDENVGRGCLSISIDHAEKTNWKITIQLR